MNEEIAQKISMNEITKDEDEVIIQDPYMYAAIPENVPNKVKKVFWGFANKQIALSNITEDDLASIHNRLRIAYLERRSNRIRDELLEEEQEENLDYNNLRVLVTALASLGKNGTLLKEMSKKRKEITIQNMQPTKSTGGFKRWIPWR